MQKDFITATPDSGGSGSTTVAAAACDRETPSRVSTRMAERNTQPFPVNNQLNQYSRENYFPLTTVV